MTAEKAEEEVKDQAPVGGQDGHSLSPRGLFTTVGGCSWGQPSGHIHQLSKAFENAHRILPGKSNSRNLFKGNNQTKVQRCMYKDVH